MPRIKNNNNMTKNANATAPEFDFNINSSYDVQQALKKLQKQREAMFDPSLIPNTNFGGRLIERYPGDVNIENIMKPVNDDIMKIEMDLDYDDMTGYAYARDNINQDNIKKLLTRYHDYQKVLEDHNVYDSFIRSLNVIDRLFDKNNFEQTLTNLMHQQALSDSELLAFQEISSNLSFKNVCLAFMGMLDILTEYNKILQSNEIFRANKDKIFMEMNRAIDENGDKMSIARGVFEPFRKRRLISDAKFVEYSTKYDFDPFGNSGSSLIDPEQVGYITLGDGKPGYIPSATEFPIRKIVNGKEVWVDNNMYEPVTNMGMDNEFTNSVNQQQNNNNFNNQNQFGQNNFNNQSQGQYRTTGRMKIVNPNANNMRSDTGYYTTDQWGNTHTTIQGVDVIVSTPDGPVSIQDQDAQIQQALGNNNNNQFNNNGYNNNNFNNGNFNGINGNNPPQSDFQYSYNSDGTMNIPLNNNPQWDPNKKYYHWNSNQFDANRESEKLTDRAKEHLQAQRNMMNNQNQFGGNQFNANVNNNMYANNNNNFSNNNNIFSNNNMNTNNNAYMNNNTMGNNNVVYGTNLGDQYANEINSLYQHYYDVMGFYPNTVGQNYNNEEFVNTLNLFVNQNKNHCQVSYEFGVPTYLDTRENKLVGFFPPMVVNEIEPYYINGRYGTALVTDEKQNGSETVLRLRQENGNEFYVHFPNVVLNKLHPKTYDKRLNANVILAFMTGVMKNRLLNVDRESQEIINSGVNLTDIAYCLYGLNTVGNTHKGLVENQTRPTITAPLNSFNNNNQNQQGFYNNNQNQFANNNFNNQQNNFGYMNNNNQNFSNNNFNNNNVMGGNQAFYNNNNQGQMMANNNFNNNIPLSNYEEYPLNKDFVFIPGGEQNFGGDTKNIKLQDAIYTNTLTGKMYSAEGKAVIRKSDLPGYNNMGNNNFNNQDDDYNPYMDLHNPLYGTPGGDYSKITEYDPNTGRKIKKNQPVIYESDYPFI